MNPLLALDTATSRVVVAVGTADGELVGEASWPAGWRHGETLLAGIDRLLAEAGVDRTALAGIVAGTGPGAFTGLRVGLATAKALAHELRLPLAGVSTAEALIAVARDGSSEPAIVLLLPAGPSDRVLVRHGQPPRLLPGGMEPDLAAGDVVVAVDLDGRAPTEAIARGRRAHDGLAASLVRLGATRLAVHGSDDVAALVPEYVTLPRGVRAATGEVAWSRGPR